VLAQLAAASNGQPRPPAYRSPPTAAASQRKPGSKKTLLEVPAAVMLQRTRATRATGRKGTLGKCLPYCDQRVANREIRVWHFVIENGY
jgi:hypothetical protein